jgi:hypothetical protein
MRRMGFAITLIVGFLTEGVAFAQPLEGDLNVPLTCSIDDIPLNTVASPQPPQASTVNNVPGIECACTKCRRQSNSCNSCASCECPQKPAPCQPCPHVSTVSPFSNVNVFGAVQANAMFNTARPVAPGIPLFLAPNAMEPENTVDVQARSSSLGAAVTGPEIGDYKTSALFLTLFYNDALIVDRYGVLPIQAWGDIKNEDWRFAAGLQFNVFNPNLPTMLTFSSLLASGNVGNNFPGQFRLERYFHPTDDSEWTIQAAISEPVATGVTSSTSLETFITGAPPLRLTEDNGWPMLEGRIAYSLGALKQEGLEAKREFELGVSAIGGQLRTAIPLQPNVVADIYGIGADLRWRATDRWGIVGEFFSGESLGFVNGGVLQSVNSTTFTGIRSNGGWGEIYYYCNPCVHTHWGYGIDDPLDNDLAATQITRNRTGFANIIWDITKQLRVGFEFTYRATDYVALPDNHGTGYHTQVQWSF